MSAAPPPTPTPPSSRLPQALKAASSMPEQEAARNSVQLARQALQRGDRGAARRLAGRAAALAPELEDAWLLLAAVASPRASVAYLQRALQINPASQRARMGMHWAVGRLRSEEASGEAGLHRPGLPAPTPASAMATTTAPRLPAHPRYAHWAAPVLLTALVLLMTMAYVGIMNGGWMTGGPGLSQARAYALALLGSETPTPQETLSYTNTPGASPIPSETATQTLTPTPTATVTPLPTETATPTDTTSPTPPPTETYTPAPSETPPPPAPTPKPPKKPKAAKQAGPEARPMEVGTDENWIDVDLSSQTTYAMQGDQVMKSFVVSTGAWPNVTVTGVYRIYVKYERADMYGADYYLSGVPYIMYFYEGYGLHGTYWHNNFGHPMSHGCVNLRPAEAGWLFEFARVGTVVSIHQ